VIVGRLMAFKGEEDLRPRPDVLVEVTEVEGDRVELAFDGPVKNVRTYLQVDLADLTREALRMAQPDKAG